MTRIRKQPKQQGETLKKWLIPSKEDMCVREFKIFESGGRPGVARLMLVWKNILKHHGIALHRGYIICLHAGMKMRDNGIIKSTGEA